MSNIIHKEVLSEEQLEMWDIVKHFCSTGYYLAGGTALALQLGHRRSIDFDIFWDKEINSQQILKKIFELGVKKGEIEVLIDTPDEYTLFIKNVKFTFLHYPFKISDHNVLEGVKMVSPLDIAAMKVYALGRRGKWKDYVDLFVIFQRSGYKEVVNRAREVFGSLFSEKMFLQQLCYFEDLDRSEEVIWLYEGIDTPHVERFLTELSVREGIKSDNII